MLILNYKMVILCYGLNKRCLYSLFIIYYLNFVFSLCTPSVFLTNIKPISPIFPLLCAPGRRANTITKARNRLAPNGIDLRRGPRLTEPRAMWVRRAPQRAEPQAPQATKKQAIKGAAWVGVLCDEQAIRQTSFLSIFSNLSATLKLL